MVVCGYSCQGRHRLALAACCYNYNLTVGVIVYFRQFNLNIIRNIQIFKFNCRFYHVQHTAANKSHLAVILDRGHYYLLTQRELVCVDPKTGKTLWNNESVGKGSIMAVDGKLIVRSEKGDGIIALVEATPEGYKELGRFDQPNRSDKNSWTYPTVSDGKLYIRDQGLLLCYQAK